MKKSKLRLLIKLEYIALDLMINFLLKKLNKISSFGMDSHYYDDNYYKEFDAYQFINTMFPEKSLIVNRLKCEIDNRLFFKSNFNRNSINSTINNLRDIWIELKNESKLI